MQPQPRDAFEGKGSQRRPQERLGRRLEEVAEAVGGGYCRLQMPLRPALGIRGTVAGRRLGALEGGGGYFPPFQCISAPTQHKELLRSNHGLCCPAPVQAEVGWCASQKTGFVSFFGSGTLGGGGSLPPPASDPPPQRSPPSNTPLPPSLAPTRPSLGCQHVSPPRPLFFWEASLTGPMGGVTQYPNGPRNI